jgi:two-component sensor histidine kinase
MPVYDITERKECDKKIRDSLKEKEVLLQEVHHRVKNNLQVISSILNLQSSYVNDEKTIEVLKESQQRIKSMSFYMKQFIALLTSVN